jgi:hypothetical protein
LGRTPLITAASYRFPHGGGEIIVNIMQDTTTKTLAQAEVGRINDALSPGPATALRPGPRVRGRPHGGA